MVYFSCSTEQENIKFEFLDRSNSHISFLDLCGGETKDEYVNISRKSKDSIVLYFEGFKQGTKLPINTDKKEYSKFITKDSLIHQKYLDYMIVDKSGLISSSYLRVEIKYYLPDYPEYSYDYKFIIDNIDDRILNSKSIVLNINKRNNKNYVLLGYSSVDEVKYDKLKKKMR
ncbi:hypothetical protein [Mesonia mobilis]|uniref:Uncharacterized protein n=1 Tax=Mesonia mobilis TaxID=369791 RepID=A0ABQ3BKX6_9FLAO|nr:hypothetical protein [Mesonia mobilis]MBQ0737607.1 hypothetical protein [Aquimarina celericrescens]GGZ48948.1 hypothetical protein GCM10008088_07850 [Mesonia mobilis]